MASKKEIGEALKAVADAIMVLQEQLSAANAEIARLRSDDYVTVPREPTEAMVNAGMAAMKELVRPALRPIPKPSIEELEKILNSEALQGVQINPDGSIDTLEERTTTTRAAALAAYRAMIQAIKEVKDE